MWIGEVGKVREVNKYTVEPFEVNEVDYLGNGVDNLTEVKVVYDVMEV